MSIYINEPLVQRIDVFTQFMGGLSGIMKSSQALNKLTAAPRHWRGTKIAVQYKSSHYYDHSVQTTVYEDGFLVHCNHVNQELEIVSSNAGMDEEYSEEASICLKCGDGWNKDGGLIVEGNYKL